MTATSPIDRVRALLKPSAEPSQSDLQQVIADLDQHAAEAEARLDGLADDRERALVNAGAKEVAAVDEKIRIDRFTIEQAHALLSEVRRLLDRVVERDRLAQLRSRREAVEALMAKSAKAMSEWPRIVDAVRAVLRTNAEADDAAARFAKDYPDEPPILLAEDRVRRVDETRKIVSERREWGWVTQGGTVYTGDPGRVCNERMLEANYRPQSREGEWGYSPLVEIEAGRLDPATKIVFRTSCGSGERVYPRRVLRRGIEFTPASRPDALATTVTLPPLLPGDSGWEATDSGHPASILAALAATPRPGPATRLETEFVAIDEPRVLQLPAAARAA